MVHNSIEYDDMQLIAEAYDILHCGLGLTNVELHKVFAEWNRGELESYLVEITADIFAKLDSESDQAIVDLILDEAAQKGTGKWASQNSLDLGAPAPTFNAAVESRIISAYKDERVEASGVLCGPEPEISLETKGSDQPCAGLLIVLGGYIILKPYFEKRQLFGKAEQS